MEEHVMQREQHDRGRRPGGSPAHGRADPWPVRLRRREKRSALMDGPAEETRVSSSRAVSAESRGLLSEWITG